MIINSYKKQYKIFYRDNLAGNDVNTVEALNDLKLTFTKDDISVVKYICHLISDRAAILVSICTFTYFFFK